MKTVKNPRKEKDIRASLLCAMKFLKVTGGQSAIGLTTNNLINTVPLQSRVSLLAYEYYATDYGYISLDEAIERTQSGDMLDWTDPDDGRLIPLEFKKEPKYLKFGKPKDAMKSLKKDKNDRNV